MQGLEKAGSFYCCRPPYRIPFETEVLKMSVLKSLLTNLTLSKVLKSLGCIFCSLCLVIYANDLYAFNSIWLRLLVFGGILAKTFPLIAAMSIRRWSCWCMVPDSCRFSVSSA